MLADRIKRLPTVAGVGLVENVLESEKRLNLDILQLQAYLDINNIRTKVASEANSATGPGHPRPCNGCYRPFCWWQTDRRRT